MFTAAFWQAAVERAVRTFAQTFGALLVADPLIGLVDFDWVDGLQVSGMAAVASLLTSIGASAFTPGPGPSLIAAEVLSPPARPQE
jgi:hypothetical protein